MDDLTLHDKIKKVIKDRESQISETLMSGALYYIESEIKEYNKEL